MNPTSNTLLAPAPTDVLIVDDDPAALRLIAKIISNAGFKVRCAADAYQAIEQFRCRCPEIVISDWEMPGVKGPDLCRIFRQETPSNYIYIVLLTARNTDADLIEGLTAGADDFLSKPINAPILMARLAAGLRVLEMEKRLRESARVDPLTGLLNCRTFHERMLLEWKRAERTGRSLSCVMVDLDFFKKVNDTHGHIAGDAVLKAVARILEDRRRENDVLCRYGGEEFCALLPDTDEAGAAAWSDRSRAAIAEMGIRLRDEDVRITASFGVSQRLMDTPTPETLVDLADQALRVAKRLGRNHVVRHSTLGDPSLEVPDGGGGPLEGLLARDIMNLAILCPSVDDSVAHVAQLLLQLRMNSVPVVTAEGQLAGIVSELDLANATVQGQGWDQPVSTVMRTEVVAYEETVPARQIFDFLSRVALRRVVVVSEGKPTGVISRATFLRWLSNWSLLQPAPDSLGQSEPAAPPEVCRQNILQIVDIAQQRLSTLRTRVAEDASDPIPCIVGEATRLQELTDGLLGQSNVGVGF